MPGILFVSLMEVEYDPIMRITTEYHEDVENDGVIIHEYQDMKDIVELNKAQYAQVDERARWTPLRDSEQLGAHVGRPPMLLMMQLQRKWLRQGLSAREQTKAFLDWLEQPENRHWRTRPGRLL